jgi:hypothetical protein
MTLGFTQPVTEMRPEYISGSKERPERNPYNLTAIFGPTVWDSQHLTTL